LGYILGMGMIYTKMEMKKPCIYHYKDMCKLVVLHFSV
jgi:hypothetical protein